MARRRIAEKREVTPDPVYNSKVVAKLINKLMRDGKKSKAEKICYECFDIIRKRTKKNPLEVFLTASPSPRDARIISSASLSFIGLPFLSLANCTIHLRARASLLSGLTSVGT